MSDVWDSPELHRMISTSTVIFSNSTFFARCKKGVSEKKKEEIGVFCSKHLNVDRRRSLICSYTVGDITSSDVQ